jgi:hypothetical protein
MMKKFSLRLTASMVILLAAVVLVEAQSAAGEPQNEVEVRGTFSIPSGEASFGSAGNSGSTISFSRDFDFSNEFGFEVRYQRKSANLKHKFLVDYSDTGWERSATLTRSFTFRGETYVANASLAGNLSLRQFRAMYAYRWGNEKLRFGPMFDAGVITTRLKISGTTNNGARTGEGSITKLAATIGYDVDYDPHPKVNLFNNLGAIAFQGERLFHVEGGAKYFPSRHFGLSGGYRFQRYKVNDDPDFLTVRSNGPFFGGVVRF